MLYSRVFLQILDSSLAEDWQARHLFEDVLKLVDRDGVLDMTVGALSRRINMPREIVQAKLRVLMAPDPESRTPTEEGRRLVLLDPDGRDWGWRVVNWGHYQGLQRAEDKRRADRERIAARRAEAKTRNGEESQGVAPRRKVSQESRPVAKSRPIEVDIDIDPESPPKAPPQGEEREREIEWRVGQAWEAHVTAHMGWLADVGEEGPRPRLTREARSAIEASLDEHDADLLGPEDRREWCASSVTLAAGVGIYLHDWHTGRSTPDGRRYLEHWRPWRAGGSGGSQTSTFADLAFADRAAEWAAVSERSPPDLPEPGGDLAKAPGLMRAVASHVERSGQDPQTWVAPCEVRCIYGRAAMVEAPSDQIAWQLSQLLPETVGGFAVSVAGPGGVQCPT